MHMPIYNCINVVSLPFILYRAGCLWQVLFKNVIIMTMTINITLSIVQQSSLLCFQASAVLILCKPID